MGDAWLSEFSIRPPYIGGGRVLTVQTIDEQTLSSVGPFLVNRIMYLMGKDTFSGI